MESFQAERELLPAENETDVNAFEVGDGPANGCTICKGSTFLPNKVPNQNVLQEPPFNNLTCQQWQDEWLPIFTPNGDDCATSYFYQELYISCCVLAIPRYQCEENVHNLLSSNENYNTAVPPIVRNEKPLEINTDIVFEYLESVDVMTGSATILVTLILKWKDPRLAWTIDSNSICADFVNIWAGYDIETTSIWVPDFDLYNIIEGFQGMPAAMATIYYDGSVSWQRSGSITAMCSYTGLGNIPFDVLGCQFLFGARSRFNANMIHYRLSEENITVGRSDLKYSEFRAVPELFEKGYTWYYNKDYGSAIYYNFYFERATNFYLLNIVVPAIILTYASFCTYLLDMRVGERLGFAMALALVIIAAQIVTFDLVPVSNEKLWIDKFVTWSFYWVLIVLVQSVFVAYLSFLREDREAKKEAKKSTSTEENENISQNDPNEIVEETNGEEDNNEDRDAWVDEGEHQHATAVEKPKWNSKVASIFYTYPLRKFDYICLAASVASYTIFVIAMFVSNFRGAWVKGDPNWDDSTTQYGLDQYVNNDPNA